MTTKWRQNNSGKISRVCATKLIFSIFEYEKFSNFWGGRIVNVFAWYVEWLDLGKLTIKNWDFFTIVYWKLTKLVYFRQWKTFHWKLRHKFWLLKTHIRIKKNNWLHHWKNGWWKKSTTKKMNFKNGPWKNLKRYFLQSIYVCSKCF